MNIRYILHTVASVIVWFMVILIFMVMISDTLFPNTGPGTFDGYDNDGVIMVLAVAVILGASWWYRRGYPQSSRYLLMAIVLYLTWVGSVAAFGNIALELLAECLGFLILVGIWYHYEKKYFLASAGVATDSATHYRGTQVVDARDISPPPTTARRVRHTRIRLATSSASPVEIGGVPIPREVEPQHFLFAGAPGTGKSVAVSNMLAPIRARGERAIVYDPTGEYLSVFFQLGDTILNPLDRRSAAWSPWVDAPLGITDYEKMAEALVPENRDQPFWHQAGRALLASVLAESAETGSVEEVVRLIQTASDDELKAVVQRHGLSGMVGSPQTFANVRSAAAAPTTSLRYLRDPVDGSRPFSLRQWASTGSGWLWLTSRADQHAVLRPLISLWVDLAVTGVMVLSQSHSRRIWLVLDELPTLQRLPALGPALAGGRKYGLASVLGIQSIAQLRESYGRDGAEAMLGQPQTQLLLRLPDPETAQWASRAIGERHVVREIVGESYTPTVSTQSSTWQHRIEAAVLPSEIQALPKLEGYLRVSDSQEVHLVRLTPVPRTPIAVAYVPVTSPMTAAREKTEGGSGGAPNVVERSTASATVEHPLLPEVR